MAFDHENAEDNTKLFDAQQDNNVMRSFILLVKAQPSFTKWTQVPTLLFASFTCQTFNEDTPVEDDDDVVPPQPSSPAKLVRIAAANHVIEIDGLSSITPKAINRSRLSPRRRRDLVGSVPLMPPQLPLPSPNLNQRRRRKLQSAKTAKADATAK